MADRLLLELQRVFVTVSNCIGGMDANAAYASNDGNIGKGGRHAKSASGGEGINASIFTNVVNNGRDVQNENTGNTCNNVITAIDGSDGNCGVAGKGGIVAQNVPAIDRGLLERVVAVINGKGGVGKTTLTANVAALTALSGQRVLAIDLDPQGNLEDDFGYADMVANDRGQSLAKALMFGGGVEPLTAVRSGVDVWAGGEALNHAAASFNALMGKNPAAAKLSLAGLLQHVAAEYDLILIDCPPGDGPLQQAALAAARWALVPTRTDNSSIKGLQSIAARFDDVLDVNTSLDLLGVVLTDVGTPMTNHKTQQVVRRQAERGARVDIAEMFGVTEGIVFDPTVRHSEAVARDGRKLGLVAHELDAQSKAEAEAGLWWKIRRGEANATKLTSRTAGSVADDLQAVTQELWNRIASTETEGASA